MKGRKGTGLWYLEAVVEALGLGLDLMGVLQYPLVQDQRLAPLLHQHVGLGYVETPEGGPGVKGDWASKKHLREYQGLKGRAK